jgi:hypothetical protein
MATALALIEAIAQRRTELRRDRGRRLRLARLQRWQLERLRRTYADFAQDERYASALDFFTEDLYGPHEFMRRDADLRKVLASWERLLPQRALRALVAALELELLTLELDCAILDALGAASADDVSYARAYRSVDRRAERIRQIRLIVNAGWALDELIRMPAIGAALRVARAPARLARVMALHAFLERGYAAFARMQDAKPLLDAIETRETRIMTALFAGAPAPFQLQSRSA